MKELTELAERVEQIAKNVHDHGTSVHFCESIEDLERRHDLLAASVVALAENVAAALRSRANNRSESDG